MKKYLFLIAAMLNTVVSFAHLTSSLKKYVFYN